MVIRLKIIVEGQTEESFVNQVLMRHLVPRQVYPSARCVATCANPPRQSRLLRGGTTSYRAARNDILRWLRQEEHRQDVFVTTMLDLYALPPDFPGFEATRGIADCRTRVRALQAELARDINFPRFIPYLQLHEYEALLLSDPAQIGSYVEMARTSRPVAQLAALAKSAKSPEEINDKHPPSHRIIHLIPAYEGLKPVAGPSIASSIGLAALRGKCPHFNSWLTQIESLNNPPRGKLRTGL